jgi:anthranilate synthase component I
LLLRTLELTLVTCWLPGLLLVCTATAPCRYNRTGNPTNEMRREWVMHLQAGAGVVADSVPEAEYEETVNKAAALGRAIDLAESAFLGSSSQ